MSDLETILTLMKLPGVGPARLRRALELMAHARMPIEEAFSNAGRRLLASMGLSTASPRSAISATVDRLLRDDVKCLVVPLGDLPIFAREHLPPVLFVRGPTHLLGARGVGFSGSRAATERGIGVATDVAEQRSSPGETRPK